MAVKISVKIHRLRLLQNIGSLVHSHINSPVHCVISYQFNAIFTPIACTYMSSVTHTPPAWLLLKDGTLLQGKSIGALGTTGGEICFNTGMTGYQEVFTDPSYTGQVLIMNAVHIGNYGAKSTDTESDSAKIKGLICKNVSDRYSRMTADGALADYLAGNNIVGIYDIDTRALVQHVRTKGAMNCLITTELTGIGEMEQALNNIPDMSGLELSSQVSTAESYRLGDSNSPIRIAVLDFGVKRHILECMVSRGAQLQVYPAKTSFTAMQDFNPNGYFLSNGPGDPAAMGYAVATARDILASSKPLFGICLGHQLLALANGISTYKMHYGHRGLNHPVKNLLTGKAEITTQNHGFGVNAEDVQRNANIEVTHINLNDGSIEGIRLKDKPAFSVQYHPESTPGPHDSRYLFDEFLSLATNGRER
jgi:carbamoyl-phosphate synthase small subunit